MITRLRVKNFKALRDVDLALTPIHVLIGPNDSGKTSILDALAALFRSVDHELADAFLGSWKGTELVWAGHADLHVNIDVDFDDDVLAGYGITVKFKRHDAIVSGEHEIIRRRSEPAIEWRQFGTTTMMYAWFTEPTLHIGYTNQQEGVDHFLRGIHYYRWDPQFLALPVAPDARRRFRMESNGFGLALCLDEILSYDPDARK